MQAKQQTDQSVKNLNKMAALGSQTSLHTAVSIQLECPVCFEPCRPPIFICLNGHNVCGDCQRRLTECAVCRGPKPTGRNLFAEALSNKVTHPPRTSCWARIKDGVECSWRGAITDLSNHVASRHPSRFTMGDAVQIAWKYNAHALTHRISLLQAEDALFWVVLCMWPTNNIVYATVRRVVTPEDSQYRFGLRFASVDGEQELMFSSGVAELWERGDSTKRALRVHADALKTFAVGGVLRCEVHVEKVAGEKAEGLDKGLS